MKIISHRGYWVGEQEKNSTTAFDRALSAGFGIETDIRDCCGKLVISHDIPMGGEQEFEDFLAQASKTKSTSLLALNIKSDGLARPIQKIAMKFSGLDFFVFDMSIPDMKSYLDLGIPVYTRVSEVESEPIWLSRASGVWLDSFGSEWFNVELVDRLLGVNKGVCVVSPELHGRRHQECWQKLKSLANADGLSLCTDYPTIAEEYFNMRATENHED